MRGNTARKAIQLAREANAKKIYFASCSPPIRYPASICLPPLRLLRTIPQICEHLERPFYQRLDDLIAACGAAPAFECSCFTNEYVAI